MAATAANAGGAEAAGTGEVKPTAAAPRKPPKVEAAKPSRPLQKGDVICGSCGEANAPSRKFCSRCGASLAEAVAARVRWWQRFRHKEAVAGQRPWTEKDGKRKKAQRKGFAKFLVPARKYLSIALVVLGLLYGVYSPFRNKVNSTVTKAKDKVSSFIHPKYDPITAGPDTTTHLPDIDPKHPGLMAIDGFKNTYWLAPIPTLTNQPELDVTFTQSSNIDKIIVHNGASDDFQGHARPKTILFVFNETGQQAEVSLKNVPDPQTISVPHGHGVTTFKMRVTSVYESVTGTDMALTEVEFFSKR